MIFGAIQADVPQYLIVQWLDVGAVRGPPINKDSSNGSVKKQPSLSRA